uniref:MIP36202p1 n=1 Tax=Drosophila melanogaster TaxID=7227 RepID=I7F4N0_DROME|nr:MIP36202p1 [Drosophila melanogaster]
MASSVAWRRRTTGRGLCTLSSCPIDLVTGVVNPEREQWYRITRLNDPIPFQCRLPNVFDLLVFCSTSRHCPPFRTVFQIRPETDPPGKGERK